MVDFIVAFKRIYRRIKNIFDKDIFTYEMESCYDCGQCYRVWFDAKDELYLSVVGHDGLAFCLSCFVKRANQKHIQIKSEDIIINFITPEME